MSSALSRSTTITVTERARRLLESVKATGESFDNLLQNLLEETFYDDEFYHVESRNVGGRRNGFEDIASYAKLGWWDLVQLQSPRIPRSGSSRSSASAPTAVSGKTYLPSSEPVQLLSVAPRTPGSSAPGDRGSAHLGKYRVFYPSRGNAGFHPHSETPEGLSRTGTPAAHQVRR